MIFGQTREQQQTEELSAESHGLLVEAMLMENLNPDELEALLTSHEDVSALAEEEVVTERTIVRLDKNARLSHLQKMSVFTIAKEKNDPMFNKLLTVWRMERYLESVLNKKYGNEALRRARQSVNKSASSRSNTLKTVAKKVNNQFNKPPKNITLSAMPNVSVPKNFK